MGTTKLAILVTYQLIKILLSVLELTASALLSIILLPIFALIWSLNVTARAFISLLLYYEYKYLRSSSTPVLRTELIQNGVDGIWSYQKPGNSRNVLIVYVYGEPLNVPAFQSNYSELIATGGYGKLTKTFVKRYGYYCWKESGSEFNISDHVKVLPGAGGGQIVTETELNRSILPALTADMDESRPQWEELIVPNFKYDADADEDGSNSRKSARIYRSHHAYMDGGSTLVMCANMYTPELSADRANLNSPAHCTAPTFPYMVNPLSPSRLPAWKRTLYKAQCVLLGLSTVFRILLESSRIRSPFIMKEYSGRQIFGLSAPIQLSALKEIKDSAGTSLPTILGCVLGASVANLGQLKSESESTTTQEDEIPIGLVGAILPYPDGRPQNRFTVVNFKVPVQVSSSATGSGSKLDVLAATQRRMSALLSSPNGYINYLLFCVFGRCPAFVIQFMLGRARTPLIYSNTPWAVDRVRLWGVPVIDVFGWMPLLTTAGIGVLTVSYCDTLKFCIIADESCMTEKELQYLTSELVSQVQGLLSECRLQRKTSNKLLNGSLLV